MLPTSVGLVGRGLDSVAALGEVPLLPSAELVGWWNEEVARDVESAEG